MDHKTYQKQWKVMLIKDRFGPIVRVFDANIQHTDAVSTNISMKDNRHR